jgi:hypothetical protein
VSPARLSLQTRHSICRLGTQHTFFVSRIRLSLHSRHPALPSVDLLEALPACAPRPCLAGPQADWGTSSLLSFLQIGVERARLFGSDWFLEFRSWPARGWLGPWPCRRVLAGGAGKRQCHDIMSGRHEEHHKEHSALCMRRHAQHQQQ